MSRKLVLVLGFLAVLPLMTVSLKARGADSPKKDAGGVDDLFGAADGAGKRSAERSAAKPDAEKPFGDFEVFKSDESKRPSKPKADVAKPKLHSGVKLHGGEKAILKALKQKTSLEFVETPLKDVLDYLSKKHRIPIQMDPSGLKDVGCDPDTQVKCKLSGISLRSALEIMLDELQLKWSIHHDVLMITTLQKAEGEEYLYTKCYDVSDLLAFPKEHELHNPLAPWPEKSLNLPTDVKPVVGRSLWGSGPIGSIKSPSIGSEADGTGSAAHDTQRAIAAQTGVPAGMCGNIGPPPYRDVPSSGYDIQPMIDVVTSAVAPRSWQDNGGVGTINNVPYGVLVISQTREVHMRIEHFLADLRARRQARPTLSVELHWLWLDAQQCDRLLAGREKPSQARLSLAIDPQQLQRIVRDVPGFHAQVACESGFGTALAAGDSRSVIISAAPVVDGSIGYMPVISTPNVGLTAQVRPTLVAGTKTAILDIVSIITRWDRSRKPAIIGSAWPADKQVVATNPAPGYPRSKTRQKVGRQRRFRLSRLP